MEVVRDLEKVARRIDRITKRVDKFQKPKRTRAVELSQIPKIDPAILARVIRQLTTKSCVKSTRNIKKKSFHPSK